MPLPATHLPPVQAIVKTETAEKCGVASAMYGVFNHIRALVHPGTRLMCHCEERSDVAISQYRAGSQEDYRRNRDCLPEIAPQGHFLALRAQGAAAPLEPRNDKSEGIAPMNLCRDHCQSAWRSQPARGTPAGRRAPPAQCRRGPAPASPACSKLSSYCP